MGVTKVQEEDESEIKEESCGSGSPAADDTAPTLEAAPAEDTAAVEAAPAEDTAAEDTAPTGGGVPPRGKGGRHSIDMTHGPIMGKLIRFSVPLMLSGVLQLLFNAADIVVVGQFAGSDSLAAVGSTSSLVNLITNLFIGFSVGSNVVMARAIGRGDGEKAGRTVHTSVPLGFVSGLMVGAVGLIFGRQLLAAMDTDPDVIDKAALYLRIYFIGAPASMLYNFGAAILRAKGDTGRPLVFLIIAGAVNAGLNLVFVICCKMDVAGVATATVVSQVISAALVIACMLRETDFCRLAIKKLRFHAKELGEIIRLGLPTGLYSCMFSLSNIVIQSSINRLGKAVMAGDTAARNIEGFVYTVMNAVSNAATTFTGQNCGACDHKRIKRVFIDSLAFVAVAGTALGMAAFAAAGPLSRIYSPDPEVVALSVLRLKIILPTYFLCGTMEVAVGTLRGMGYFIFPIITSLTLTCGMRIVWVYTAFAAVIAVPGFTVNAALTMLYISYPISWALTTLAHVATYLVVFPRVKKRLNFARAEESRG